MRVSLYVLAQMRSIEQQKRTHQLAASIASFCDEIAHNTVLVVQHAVLNQITDEIAETVSGVTTPSPCALLLE